MPVEVLEVRALLTDDDLLGDSVNDPNVTEATQQSNAVVDQYAESLQLQYVDPAQQQLLDSLSQFVALTASTSSSGYGSLEGTPVAGLASPFGVGSTAEASMTAGSEAANSEYTQAVSGSGSVSSLFDQEADLAATSQGIVTIALGGLAPSSTSDSGSSSNSDGTSDSSSGSSSSGGSPSGGSSETSAGGSSGWSTDLPDGVDFEDEPLPLEQVTGDLLQYRPTELTSFSITTVTETFSDGTETATAPDDDA